MSRCQSALPGCAQARRSPTASQPGEPASAAGEAALGDPACRRHLVGETERVGAVGRERRARRRRAAATRRASAVAAPREGEAADALTRLPAVRRQDDVGPSLSGPSALLVRRPWPHPADFEHGVDRL